MNRIVHVFYCAIIILAGSLAAFGQFGSGVQGTVTDSGGAVVPGARVSITNVATSQNLETVTNENGFYSFNGLAQGTYRITVTQSGFKKKVFNNFVINAEKNEGLDISLETGEISVEVTVEGNEGATLETEDANVGRNLTNREILNLPQVGRDPYQLARLAPGVFGDGARSASGASNRIGNNGSGPGGSNNGIFAVENQTQISANGQRVTSNNYEIDGVSVNSQTWGGAAVITPTQESVAEVQVTSSTYSAEDGRNSGAQVKVITKYGTNNWSGSGFIKINDPSLNAYNKFPRTVGTFQTNGPTRVEDKFKTYGGSFGGPIFKNKLFFFFAYEGTRNKSNSVTLPTFVETASFRQSLGSLRAGTLSAAFLTSGATPRVAQVFTPNCALLIAAYNQTGRCQVVSDGLDVGSISGAYGTYVPDANNFVGGGLDGIADLQYVSLLNSSSFRGNQYVARVDYQMTEKDKLTFTSNITPLSSSTFNTAAQSRPQADFNSDRLTYLLGGIYSRTISSTMINEFRFNYTNWGFNEITSNPNANFALPRVEIEAIWSDRLRFGAPRADTTPGDFKQTQMDFRDTLTKILGNHALKFGIEYRRELNNSASPGGARPLYSFTRMWNFANGTPVFESINADANGVPRANEVPFNTANVGLFVQDNWKFRPNLTLNLGVRWEYYAPITAGGDSQFGRLQLGTNGLIDAKIVTTKQFTKKDLNNFGPQVGFSWSPKMFNNKAVVRGGFGMGYDRLGSALFSNVRFAPPNAARYSICCGSSANAGNTGATTGTIQFVGSADNTIYGYPRNPTIGGGFGANGGPNFGSVEIYSSPEDLPSAYVYRYSLEAQYELPWKTVATLGYQGSAGRHFVRILPLHLILPRLATSTFRTVYFASPDVNSNYNGMIASVRKRFSSSFDFTVNYRFSKSLDTVSLEAPCACTNQTYPFDNSTEKGPSDFDVTHYFVASATWEPSWFKGQKNIGGDLLAGWSFSPIVTWRGGFPWTPVIGQSIQLSTDTATVGVIRPRAYYGTAPLQNDNSTFLTTGLFPNNIITGANCGTGTGCSSYFLTTRNGTSYIGNEPGVGRNVFRGPRYFAVDLSIAKSIKFPSSGFFGESAKLDLRFNFFNLFNNLNLSPFNAQSNNTRADNTQFGFATSGLAGRVGEFQARFSF
ncbi:MAG: TonB-dependent receptor [Acidobacteria bacterium]|nr:TonB-dependent receptor [Acidobacteriota bacterium]